MTTASVAIATRGSYGVFVWNHVLAARNGLAGLVSWPAAIAAKTENRDRQRTTAGVSAFMVRWPSASNYWEVEFARVRGGDHCRCKALAVNRAHLGRLATAILLTLGSGCEVDPQHVLRAARHAQRQSVRNRGRLFGLIGAELQLDDDTRFARPEGRRLIGKASAGQNWRSQSMVSRKRPSALRK